jgi:hypothetical protein
LVEADPTVSTEVLQEFGPLRKGCERLVTLGRFEQRRVHQFDLEQDASDAWHQLAQMLRHLLEKDSRPIALAPDAPHTQVVPEAPSAVDVSRDEGETNHVIFGNRKNSIYLAPGASKVFRIAGFFQPVLDRLRIISFRRIREQLFVAQEAGMEKPLVALRIARYERNSWKEKAGEVVNGL